MPTIHPYNEASKNFARSFDSNKVSMFACFRWLQLAVNDFIRAPFISLAYGIIFSIVPVALFYFVFTTENHLVILPASIAFALVGPAFASGLYDVAWELEKGHKPTLTHTLKSMFRNPSGEWGFAILLMIVMVAWTRIAALLHALYPKIAEPTLQELLPFLTIGTIVGALLAAIVFTISAFTPQMMVERRVDLMTAVSTSAKAVNKNAGAMLVWAIVILAFIALGLVTMGYGFIVIMPLLSYASWHGYIATIKTKRGRKYE